jgi:hypothetical protein
MRLRLQREGVIRSLAEADRLLFARFPGQEDEGGRGHDYQLLLDRYNMGCA